VGVSGSGAFDLELPVDGDFNGDGVVDGADLIEWQRSDKTPVGLTNWRFNYGTGTPLAAASASVAAIPEPATWTLCFGMLLSIAAGKRRMRMSC
ncbi:MAG: hypothetical protein MI725_16020, partial [Pirellulales bacterium]|nr:hypothetical protein [Pirellulales bacterium]